MQTRAPSARGELADGAIPFSFILLYMLGSSLLLELEAGKTMHPIASDFHPSLPMDRSCQSDFLDKAATASHFKELGEMIGY